MTREQIISLFKLIKIEYENFEVSSERVDLWQDTFKDQSYVQVLNRFKKHMTSNKFPPRIADLYEEPVESKVNHEHLSFMRNLRGDDFYRNNH